MTPPASLATTRRALDRLTAVPSALVCAVREPPRAAAAAPPEGDADERDFLYSISN